MENQRESQTGGSRRPARRRSSRPAGAPKPQKKGASATFAAQKSQPNSGGKSARSSSSPQNNTNQGSDSTSTPHRPRRPHRKKRDTHNKQRNVKTKQNPPRKKSKAAVDGKVVFERDGKAGKAPKRYTRSSNDSGPRPVTRHLTRKQAKRTRGRAYPETSAGGVLLRHTKRAYNAKNERVYLSTVKVPIIGRADRRGRILWSLPKGHIEDYETVPMTAEREVLEETGIQGRAFKKLGTVDYWFLSDGKRIHKTVHHYLLKYESGKLSDADPEVSEVAWVSLPELPRRLSYADERKLARRATGVVSTWIRDEYAPPKDDKKSANKSANNSDSTSDSKSSDRNNEQQQPRKKRRRRRRGSRGRGRSHSNKSSSQQGKDGE